jgi:hypothetical protein
VPISFQVADANGVPSYAIAVTGNVTLTKQSATGFVTVGPVSEVSPATATIFSPQNPPGGPADNRATGVTLKLDGTGKLYVTWTGPALSTADVIFDVNGYFVNGTAGAMYVPLTPNRILDTRSKLGGLSKLVSSQCKSFKVINRVTSDATKNVPTGAVAVTGILTVTRQQMLGYFTLSPVNSNTPATSTLNFLTDNRATGVTVPLTSSGYLYIVYKAGSGKTADAIFDVSGYFIN